MNYIPGFSNYLEASVPEYGPAPIMDAPRQPAVEPMTQEAVAPAAAPYSLSGLTPEALAGLYALSANNAGGSTPSGMAGLPSLGAGYVPQFEEKLITAPVSNKGNATAYSGMDNQFYMSPNDLVRLVDRSTNTVVFEGTGYEAAQKAVELGQGMTDAMGRKADYQIQTGKTQDSYVPVANEKFNKTTAGNIANALGTIAPLAMAFVPGLGLTTLGNIAAGAGIGAAGAGLKGDNILKGAAMGGLSAAGGALLGPGIPGIGKVGDLGLRVGTAVGTGLGATAGGVLTGQSLKNALLGGVVSGGLSYLSPDITKGLGIGGGSNVPASTGGDGFTGINVVGSAPASIGTTLGGSSPSKLKLPEAPKPETPYDGLTVTGGKFGSVGFGGNQFGAPGQDTSAFEKMYSEPYDPNEILVEASPLEQTAPVSVPPSNVGGGEITPEYLPKEDIVVDATKIERPVTGGLTLSSDTLADVDKAAAEEAEAKKKLGVEEYLRLLSLAAGVAGGGGGSGQTGTYTSGGRGLNPIFSAKLPSAGGLGTIGANRTVRPMGDVDWLTYGTRPELSFFDYASQNNPAPVTTPEPNNPAGPIMEERDPMAMAKGGRSTFAVNGPGTGRSDDIPAVLSDGEYVIDAETVALLGDGSSKAGAKKLDDLRVKVRKHKGQKLAKGRFSANAKKPEAYLSGGRI